MELQPAIIQEILSLREQIDPAQTCEGYCGDASGLALRCLLAHGIEAELCDAGTVRDRCHVFVILADGTIVDPTLDQFYRGGRGNTTGDWEHKVWAERDDLSGSNPWRGTLAVIPPDHPFARHYCSHRRENWSELYDGPYWIKGREPKWWQTLHVDRGLGTDGSSLEFSFD